MPAATGDGVAEVPLAVLDLHAGPSRATGHDATAVDGAHGLLAALGRAEQAGAIANAGVAGEDLELGHQVGRDGGRLRLAPVRLLAKPDFLCRSLPAIRAGAATGGMWYPWG
jgi:hypothetical protein